MKRVPRLLAAVFGFSLFACGSSQLVLKGPVSEQCRQTGLKGCPELTSGVLTYLDGDKEQGLKQIAAGAAQNAPSQIQAFAAKLRALEKIPGADSFVEPIREIVQYLSSSAAENKAQEGPAEVKPRPAPKEPANSDSARGPFLADYLRIRTADSDPDQIITEMAKPGLVPAPMRCGGNLLDDAAVGRCTKLIPGPFVVTDLTATGCESEVVVVAALDSFSPAARWRVTGPVHGARLGVNEGEALFVVVQAPNEKKLRIDPRCTLIWSGFHPYDAEAERSRRFLKKGSK